MSTDTCTIYSSAVMQYQHFPPLVKTLLTGSLIPIKRCLLGRCERGTVQRTAFRLPFPHTGVICQVRKLRLRSAWLALAEWSSILPFGRADIHWQVCQGGANQSVCVWERRMERRLTALRPLMFGLGELVNTGQPGFRLACSGKICETVILC